MRTKAVLVAIVGGVVVTLLTGLVENMPAMLVGAVHYGYPLAWLIRLVIALEFNPWRVEYVNLVFDIIVWAVLVLLILFALSKRRK
jgi:hypothetical protein